MRKIRIYQPGDYVPGDLVELATAGSQHVAVVLRMREGDSLVLFRGDNSEFAATITAVHKKKVTVQINARADVNRESSCAIHLAQAISKGERMELVIQKAVELGVTSITPLISTHCVVRLDAERLLKKHQQWQAIAVSACEQSGRNKLPVIYPVCPLEIYLQQCSIATKFVLAPTAKSSWRDYPMPVSEIAILIGPEGGFCDEEIQQAQSAQFKLLSLGPRILRTETAAIAALSLLQAVSGDL